MPNANSGNQFPMPPGGQDNPPPSVNLTDDVAPDLSAPTFQPASEPAPQPSYQPEPTPITPAPVVPQPQPASPASYAPKKRFPLVSLILIIVAIAATATTYFFYQQTQGLTSQLNQLQQTLSQQQIQTTPTPLETITPTPETTVSAVVSPTAVTGIPSVSVTLFPSRSVIGQAASIFALTQQKYPDAQLLMITATDIQSDSQIITKYWFRQNLTGKKYLYVMKEPGKDPVIVDQQVYISPDDNIPSLNQAVIANQLGSELTDIYSIALNLCPTNYNCSGASATGQYIKVNTPLWQVTFTAPGSTKPFVVQIDAISQKVLYKSQ